LGADPTRFWPIERTLYIWFGEFLESDIYYGLSHVSLIDSDTFFDYSPYSITNIFGDNAMRILITDILSLFNGPVELDELPTMNLKHLGGSLIPGVQITEFQLMVFKRLMYLTLIRENGKMVNNFMNGFLVFMF
jgi:hypothetical protein